MDFIDEVKALAARVPNLIDNIQTEEATKNALVMPMINILGYNVFDPTEVIPEFTADHGTKKGEKVDYAIIKDNEPIMLIECKPFGSDLNTNHASQLFRYFNVTSAKVGILTNGTTYRFFSDLEDANKMDDKPFLEIDLLNLKDEQVEELKRFKKERFDICELESVANELKYTKEIKQILLKEMNKPSEDFVKFFANQVYNGRITLNKRDQFTAITKNAFNQFINDRINDRLKIAMSDKEDNTPVDIEDDIEPVDDGIVTTEDEIEGYHIVKAILREKVAPERIVMRDTKSYCGILLDDNNRKPICRLRFNRSQKYVGILDENRKEIKHPIEELNDIYALASEIEAAVKRMEEQKDE
ncbi:type I restriction endonuclease [uncultured Methanolobus sp.]|uniref:type I restriction endonuclease n=1 Tax=uncultured Methanolobus sp. TaxID=218300 RepID=UPI002AAB5AC6|nr:type I restriction endonuclease [uncultured Methanolobus sp.]